MSASPRAAGLLLTLAVAGVGCTHPIGKRLRTAADHGAVPEGLSVVYDDYHPRWGGQRIRVTGRGEVVVRRWRPGEPPGAGTVWRGKTGERKLHRLVETLVRIEAWEHRDPGPAPRLYEHRAELVVTIGEARQRVWEWATDLEANPRLAIVRDVLERLIRQARTGKGRSAATG